MAVLFDIKDRNLIPNWRDFNRTLQIGELSNFSLQKPKLDLNINRSIEDWRGNKNLGIAADLVTSSFVAGIKDKPEVTEAIALLVSNSEKLSGALLEIIKKIQNADHKVVNSTQILEKGAETLDDFRCFIDDNLFNNLIHRTKVQAKKNLVGAVTWVELARLYSINGQEEQADRAMSIALHIAPSNRFVLRSATRLYIHIGKPEKALFYLRRSDAIKYDPWLLSAHIATSAVMDRHSPLIKNGIGALQSKNFSDFDKTELASSIGTIELKNGSFKKAKGFIDQSLIRPNDNSLAQLEWLTQEDSRFKLTPSAFRNVINPFEAYALDFFNKGLWNDAFQSCLNWYLDLPYSKRPVLLGSFIACSAKQDFEASITLCEVGLKSNPGDADILNNIVYSYAKLDKIDQAEIYLKQFLNLVKNNQLDNDNIISFQATLGLVFFRLGKIEPAKEYYKLAILNAEKIGEAYLRDLAIVNFTYELVRNNDPEKGHYLLQVKQIKETAKELDLLAAIEGVSELQRKLGS